MLAVLCVTEQSQLNAGPAAEALSNSLVAPRVSDYFEPQMFEPEYWQQRNAVTGVAGGRGKVLFLRAGDQEWVLRHYHRGGLMTPLLDDRYLWRGADATRSFREWRLLRRLHDEGFPVPAAVAARYIREGPFYRADLITVRIPDARSLADVVGQRVPPLEVWRAVGACIRQFHDAGVYHADLNAHNILLDNAGQVYLVDFDRGGVRRGQRWRQANLRRLNRSLHKIGLSLTNPDFEVQQWAALVEGYQ